MFTTPGARAASILLVRSLRAIAAILLISLPLLSADSAQEYARRARQASEAGDVANAYLYYAQAAALAPENSDYWVTSQALRTQALDAANALPGGLAQTIAENESPDTGLASVLGKITADEIAEADRLLPPAELAGDPERQSFDLEGDGRVLWEAISAAFDLGVVFDGDYQPGRRQTLRLDDADFREALHVVSAATNAFAVPVSETLLLVANDTEQKRSELEPTMAVVIPLPETVSVEDAQEISQAVQQSMEIQRLVLDSGRQMVLIRDRVSKVRPAQQLFEEILRRRPEVVVEAEFLEVTENSSLRYGMDLQSSFPLVWLGDLKNVITSVPSGFRFLTFGGGATMFGIGIANAELFASMSRSSSNTLLRSTLRSVSGQTATMHVGERFPVITGGYYGPVEGPGEVYRPPPTISFEDLGIVLNITPHVHGSKELTLEVEAEFKILAGESLNGIPIIANRSFQSTVRMRLGEWAIMSGLVRASEVKTISGIAGLSQLPLLGPLFRRNTTEKNSSQAILVLRPRLVYAPTSELSSQPIWTGTESRPRNPM